MSQTAKYERIASSIESDIRAGRIPSGEALDSENTLVSRYAVSRNTIRKSLSVLAEKGLISTRMGSGSFVTYAGEIIDSTAGWSVSLSKKEAKLQSRILRLTRGPMDLECAELPLGHDCLKIDRTRFLIQNGRGVSIERSRLPWRPSFEPVLSEGLKDGSITETLQAFNMSSSGGLQRVGVKQSLSEKDAELLGREPGGAMLKLQRINRAPDNSVIEFVESLLDPDLFGLSFEF